MKLYKVFVNVPGNEGFYVIAKHPTEAYRIALDYMVNMDIGYPDERDLKSVEVIADTENCACDVLLGV